MQVKSINVTLRNTPYTLRFEGATSSSSGIYVVVVEIFADKKFLGEAVFEGVDLQGFTGPVDHFTLEEWQKLSSLVSSLDEML